MRAAALALSMGAVLAACGGGGGGSPRTAATIRSLANGATSFSMAEAQSSVAVGTGRFVFGLIPRAGAPASGGSVQVWVASDDRAPATGPFPVRYVTWSAPRSDAFGKPPVPGFYEAEVTVPGPGNWLVAARGVVGGRSIVAVGATAAEPRPVAALGSPALSEPTPTASSPTEAAAIDTRIPPTPMHYISLDAALRSGRPTVVVFATPLLCSSRMCGPVVDEVLDVYDGLGPTKANFVDVEVYPQRDSKRPAPEFLRWGFQSEPWVLVIDRAGIIRGRFEGPVVAAQITDALQPLLSQP